MAEVRRECVGAFELPFEAEAAFPLFTALGEMRWVPGWQPELVYPPDGELELDQVFTTGEGAEHTLWSVIHLDREARLVEYLRVTPGSRLARVTVSVDAQDEGCRVTVRYLWTVLSPAGQGAVDEACAGHADMLTEWRRLILAAVAA